MGREGGAGPGRRRSGGAGLGGARGRRGGRLEAEAELAREGRRGRGPAEQIVDDVSGEAEELPRSPGLGELERRRRGSRAALALPREEVDKVEVGDRELLVGDGEYLVGGRVDGVVGASHRLGRLLVRPTVAAPAEYLAGGLCDEAAELAPNFPRLARVGQVSRVCLGDRVMDRVA